MELKTKVVILTKDELAALDQGQGIDLGSATQGWHDEWMWVPEYAALNGMEPSVASNLPNIDGLGNNSYTSRDHWYLHLAQTVEQLIKAAKDGDAFGTSADATEAYAIMDNDSLWIYEFWVA